MEESLRSFHKTKTSDSQSARKQKISSWSGAFNAVNWSLFSTYRLYFAYVPRCANKKWKKNKSTFLFHISYGIDKWMLQKKRMVMMCGCKRRHRCEWFYCFQFSSSSSNTDTFFEVNTHGKQLTQTVHVKQKKLLWIDIMISCNYHD